MGIAQRRALRYKAIKYIIKAGNLFRKNYSRIYLRCVEKDQADDLLKQFHDQENGTGHAVGNALVHQILRTGYYWPIMFKDAH